MNLNISMWSGLFYDMTPEQAVQQLYGSIFSLSRAYQQTLLEEES